MRLLCAAGFAFAIGCSQDEGEPCQTNRDCDDGLLCVRARGSERGECESPDSMGGTGGSGPGDVVDAAALPIEDASIDSDAGN